MERKVRKMKKEHIIKKARMRLNTLVCYIEKEEIPSPPGEYPAGSVLGCVARGIKRTVDFGDKIIDVEVKVPSLIGGWEGWEGKSEIWIKPKEIGREVVIKKVRISGYPLPYPAGYKLIIE